LDNLSSAEVDGLEIISLVDNSVDFLSTIEEKRFNPLGNVEKAT
jgi:hypothetical protein